MKNPTVEKKKGLDLSDILRILSVARKNWWVVVLFAGIFFGIGYIYVYKTEKVYVASTQLLLKTNEEFNQGSIINDAGGGYYGNMSKTFVDNSNEMRVLQSQDVIQEALNRLDFDVSYYLVGRVRTTEVYSGVPFSVRVISLNPALYEQMISMRIISLDEYELEYTFDAQKEKVTGKFNTELTTPKMKILVTRKPSLNAANFQDNSLNYLIQPHKIETLTASFLSRLTVENPQYTNVLKISVQDVLVERGTKFLDTLSTVYIENSLDSRLEINQNTLYYIDRQLEEVQNILGNIEDTLQTYREEHDVIDLDRQADLYFNKYANYDEQLHNNEIQTAALDSLENYIIEDRDVAFLPPNVYLLQSDQFEMSTVNDLYTMQRNLNSLLNFATEDNFAIQQIKAQIDSTKRDMLIYIGNARQGLKERSASIQEQIDHYDAELGGLPMKQRGLLDIMRLQRAYQDMYVFLLQRRANTVIGRASIVPQTKVIEKPRMAGLVSPNENKILMTFTSIGLILAVLIILVRTMFFNKIESYAELKSATHLPIVGEVVYDKVSADLLIAVDHAPKSPQAESFRTIRTNLQYMASDGASQIIVVTSNRPGEGKTYCSMNLAGVFAKGGRKVILLELDLHKPRIGKGLGLTSDLGLSTICIGKSTIEESIMPSAIENLSVLLAGPLPPNPSELITSRSMGDILDYCSKHYEYLIIDTPPVGLITDAMVLMKRATVTLFVINTKFPSRQSLEIAHEIADMKPSTHFGFILNGVKHKKSKYYYNRYSYGYGSYGSYGAGYGGYGSYGGYGGGSYSGGGGGRFRGPGSSGSGSRKSDANPKKPDN